MDTYTFDNYESYVDAQCRLTRHKLTRPQGYVPFAAPTVIIAIGKAHPTPVNRGLCHGVRGGEELDMFERHVGGTWVGTEIVPELCDGTRVVHHDFHLTRDDWRGLFDVVYSNSLDHAHQPHVAVCEWLRQLSHTGRLYIEWTKYSMRLGRGRNRGDCYAATFAEYEDLIGFCGGVIHDVLRVGRSSVFVVGVE